MAHFELKSIKKLPIERLSYDLKLELLESLKPRDVVELINVNQGFRSTIAREPWRIFGKHVDEISITTANNSPNQIVIKKSDSCIEMFGDEISLRPSGSSSDLIRLKSHSTLFSKIFSFFIHDDDGIINLSGSSSRLKGHKDHSTLFSKIRSCQKLKLVLSSKDEGQEEAHLLVKLLTNRDSVSELEISIEDAKAKVEQYLRVLPLNHIKKATFKIHFKERNQQLQGVLSNFVETRLNHCKSIEIDDCSLHYSFWYEPLSKIWTEMILIKIPKGVHYQERDFRGFIYRTVTKGVLSSNPEAAILIWAKGTNVSITGWLSNILSQMSGMCRIIHEDRGEVDEIFEKFLDKMIPECDTFGDSRLKRQDFLRECVDVNRSIDPKRKCIYVTWPRDILFFAKYINIR